MNQLIFHNDKYAVKDKREPQDHIFLAVGTQEVGEKKKNHMDHSRPLADPVTLPRVTVMDNSTAKPLTDFLIKVRMYR